MMSRMVELTLSVCMGGCHRRRSAEGYILRKHSPTLA